jgi:hypothetical protein
MEPYRAVDAHNRSAEAQNGATEGLQTSGRRFANPLMRSRIKIRIHVKVGPRSELKLK